MNAYYSNNTNPFAPSTGNNNTSAYGGQYLGNGPGYLGPGTGLFGANAPQADAYLPQDGFISSADSFNGNFNFGVQDVCSCQFGNGASQEAFIVPAGDQDNPFGNDLNATALEVPAINGQNPQQALLALLEMLGISPEMVQALQAQGINILDLIAQANGMDSLAGTQTGQEMLLPTTIPATGDGMPANVYMPTSGPSRPTRRRRRHTETTPAPTGTSNGSGDTAPPAPPTPPAPRAINANTPHNAGGVRRY